MKILNEESVNKNSIVGSNEFVVYIRSYCTCNAIYGRFRMLSSFWIFLSLICGIRRVFSTGEFLSIISRQNILNSMGIALAKNRYFISLGDCMRLSAHTEQLKTNSTFCSALVHRRFFFAITHWHRPHILPRITEGTHRNSCTLRSIYCSLSLNKNNNSSVNRSQTSICH